MSSAASYSNVLVGYFYYPVLLPAIFRFITGSWIIYALDDYGNYVSPILSGSTGIPSGISFYAAFNYPFFTFYFTMPSIMPYIYPMIINFDYPAKFVTINMYSGLG